MVQKVGILPPRNIEQLQFAFAVYQMEDDVGLEQSLQFKRSFSVEVRIKFIGVWYVTRSIVQPSISFPFRDTVESVGLFEKRLPFCVSDNAIEHFRHAVALDERRVKFTPTYFHAASQHEKTGGVPCELKHRVDGLHVNATDVEEVFFAGAHCGMLLVFRRTTDIIYRYPFRCRRWICSKWRTFCTRPHSPSVDD